MLTSGVLTSAVHNAYGARFNTQGALVIRRVFRWRGRLQLSSKLRQLVNLCDDKLTKESRTREEACRLGLRRAVGFGFNLLLICAAWLVIGLPVPPAHPLWAVCAARCAALARVAEPTP